jgi:hypothetical protein
MGGSTLQCARYDNLAGHYDRNLQTKAREVRLQVPKFSQQTFAIGEVFICIRNYRQV